MKNRVGSMVNAYLKIKKGDKFFYYAPESDVQKIYEAQLVDKKIQFTVYPNLNEFEIDVVGYVKLPNDSIYSYDFKMYENNGNESFFLYKTKEDAIKNIPIQPERINIAEYIDGKFGNVPFFTNPTIYEVNYGLRKITAMDFSELVAKSDRAIVEIDFETPLNDKDKIANFFRIVNKQKHYFIDKEDAEKSIREFEFITFHN